MKFSEPWQRNRHSPRGDRRSIRLRGFDYSTPGAYFVTIGTYRKAHLFGEVVNGAMRLSAAGQMVKAVWDAIPDCYPGVDVDAFVVMPDHIHGIILLENRRDVISVGVDPCVDPDSLRSGVTKKLSLSEVVQRVKSLTTKRYIDGVRHEGWPPFRRRLWERNYYERIVRNDEALNRIRVYISNNPVIWSARRVKIVRG